MFQHYTEQAKQALFLAFYYADQGGCSSIEPKHLLAGMLAADPTILQHYPQLTGLVPLVPVAPPHPAVLEPAPRRYLPLTESSRKALAYAAEEVGRLRHKSIGTEHIFAGLLRETDSRAAAELLSHGVTIQAVRENLKSLTAR